MRIARNECYGSHVGRAHSQTPQIEIRAGEHKTTPELSVLKEAEVAASVRRHAGFDDTQGSEAVDPGRVRSVGEHGEPSLVSNNREAIAPPEKIPCEEVEMCGCLPARARRVKISTTPLTKTSLTS